MSSKKTVLIIGAGIGGLATAGLLAKDGYDVTVVEKNDQPGGRCGLFEADGFRFDMGPSWYLMPEMFERWFHDMGTSVEEHLDLRPIDPQYRVFFADGSQEDVGRNREEIAELFEKLEPGAAKRLDRYLQEAKYKYDFAVDKVLYRNMDSLFDFVNWELIRFGLRKGSIEPMSRYVSRFFSSEKLQQILQYTLVFLGGSPKNTPALYSLMSHIDFEQNVFYPMGGMYELPRAMEAIAKQHGVKFRYSQPVDRLETKDGRVTTVWSQGEPLTADIIISNADYHFTDQAIDDPNSRLHTENQWQRKTLAPSAFLLYLGIKGKVPEFLHHNLYFADNWMEHFADIYDHPQWPQQPSLYISMRSHMDDSVAPADHENMMVFVPIASNLKETDQSRAAYAAFILDYIAEKLGVDLRGRIVHQSIFSVSDFAARYNSFGGSSLGLAHTLFQTAIFRPPNQHPKLSNLLFVGGNTVPGIGVPMTLISADLARQRVQDGETRS